MYKKIIFITLLALYCFNIRAQVTIGSVIPPEEGALLDIKTKEPGADNATTDKNGGGLLLPRVSLTGGKNSLEPFYDNSVSGGTQKALRYTGLVVYNQNTPTGLDDGFYSWDGAEWKPMESKAPDDSWLAQGNSGVLNTDFVGTTDSKPFRIKTKNQDRIRINNTDGRIGIGNVTVPGADLHVVGNMAINDAPVIEKGAWPLGVDNTKVGKLKTERAKSRALFMQSTATDANPTRNRQNISPGEINGGSEVVLKWDNADPVVNSYICNIFYPIGEFSFASDILCVVDGYVNITPYAPPSEQWSTDRNRTVAAITLCIMYQSKGTGAWTELSSATAKWEWGAANDIAQTILLPSKIKQFKRDDRIKMIVKRPSSNYGLEFKEATIEGKDYITHVGSPTGTQFSKGLKIREIVDK